MALDNHLAKYRHHPVGPFPTVQRQSQFAAKLHPFDLIRSSIFSNTLKFVIDHRVSFLVAAGSVGNRLYFQPRNTANPRLSQFVQADEAEILGGIELLSKGKRRDSLLAAAEAMFSEDFAGRVFAFDSDAARVFAKIAVARRGLGISHADAQIAALAQVRGAKLPTRNVASFEDCGIEVFDPWNS